MDPRLRGDDTHSFILKYSQDCWKATAAAAVKRSGNKQDDYFQSFFE